jgi:hypothetical protein
MSNVVAPENKEPSGHHPAVIHKATFIGFSWERSRWPHVPAYTRLAS